ncbi:fatty acid synthase alpha subunit Lsd1, partial [Coemansia sp. RSA 1939]
MAEIDNKFQAESVAINVKLSDPEGDATFMLEVVLHEGVVVEVKEIFKGFVKTLDSESSIVSAVVLEALFMSYAASWITNPKEELPSTEYLLSVAVSIPVVGLTQLMQIVVLYKTLGIAPGELAASFKELAGHSQGISTATALSMATDEESFYDIAKKVLGLLMITGIFPQKDYPPARVEEKSNATSGISQSPTSMVCVLKLTRTQLQRVIDQHNIKQKTPAMHTYIALVNGDRFFVVSGVVSSVAQLVRRLVAVYDVEGIDQSRINFSQRKPKVMISYVSIKAPYHCVLLEHAVEKAQEYAKAKGWQLDAREMRCAVRANDDGHDIRTEANLTDYLLESMCVLPVDWPLAVRSTCATHMVDFGPGG